MAYVFNKEDKVVYYDLYTDNKTISEAKQILKRK